MQRVLGVLTMVFVLGTVACGGDKENPGIDAGTEPGNDAGTSPDGEIPFSQWCSTVETGHENSMLRTEQVCGQTGITAEDLPHLGDVPFGIPVNAMRLANYVNCDPAAQLGSMNAAFADAIQAGRMNYDAAKAAECRALGRANNGNIDAFGGGNYLIEPCGSVLVGNVAVGETCQLNEECVKGAYCKPGAADSCAGTCADRIAVGAACVPGRDLCVVDSACEEDGAGNFVCVAGAAAGEACDPDNGPFCASGLICGAGLTCIAPAAEGGTCTDSSECASGLVCGGGACVAPAALGGACGEGVNECGACLRCQDPSEVAAGAQTTCVPWEVGATCRTDADCPVNAFCNPGTGSNTCVLKPRIGESCTVAQLEDGSFPAEADRGNCLYNDAFCKRTDPGSPNGTCALAPKLGEACSNAAAIDKTLCAEGFCSDATGTCVELVGEGAACTASEQCAMGLYCATNACVPFPAAGEPCTPDSECDAMSYCDESADAPICTALLAAGEVCTDDAQCQVGLCNPVSGTCMAACADNYDASSCGCPGEGAKGYSMYLLFALVLLPGLARRRSSK